MRRYCDAPDPNGTHAFVDAGSPQPPWLSHTMLTNLLVGKSNNVIPRYEAMTTRDTAAPVPLVNGSHRGRIFSTREMTESSQRGQRERDGLPTKAYLQRNHIL